MVFTPGMLSEINEQIDHLCSLTFSKEELDYLRSIRFIKNDYVEFLRLWHPIREYVTTGLTEKGELTVDVKGPLFSAMQFEIYLLEIINEVYFRMRYDYDTLLAQARRRLEKKIAAMNSGRYTFPFAEFGARPGSHASGRARSYAASRARPGTVSAPRTYILPSCTG